MPQKVSELENPTKEVIPIMKKRIYRRIPVNEFRPESIAHADLGRKLVFAIDVAKVDMVAAVATADGRVLHTISWRAPVDFFTVPTEASCSNSLSSRSRGTFQTRS